MISKKRVQELLDDWAPMILKAFDLEDKVINIYIVNSETKAFKRIDAASKMDGCFGYTLLDAKKPVHIWILRDKHHNELEVVGTIFHELCHVLWFYLYKEDEKVGVDIDEPASDEEEEFIQKIEKVFKEWIKAGVKLQ